MLINHEMVEGHERWSHEWDLEPNFELESFEKSEEAKCQKNANRDIYKMVKPSYFHGKDNSTPEELISILKTLEELFGENYKKVEQVRIAMVMLQGKANVWWGQEKIDHEACGQPPMNTSAN